MKEEHKRIIKEANVRINKRHLQEYLPVYEKKVVERAKKENIPFDKMGLIVAFRVYVEDQLNLKRPWFELFEELDDIVEWFNDLRNY